MSGPQLYRKIERRLRGELEIVTAMAREDILEAHVRHLLELIELAEGEISPRRVLEIYLRLHQIGLEMARKIASKSLATLGQRRAAAPPLQLSDGRVGVPDWDAPPPLLERVRRRLKGRINPELRLKVELHTGRTQVAFLRVHVENALRFVRILAPEVPISAIIAIYCEEVGLRSSVAETVYSLTLDRLSTPPLAWPDPEDMPAQTVRSAEPSVRAISAPR